MSYYRRTRFTELGALLLVALVCACGRAKPALSSGTADAAPEASVSLADSSGTVDTAPEASVSLTDSSGTADVAPTEGASPDASDVPSLSDAVEAAETYAIPDAAEAGCVGAGQKTDDPFGRACCPALVISQSTTADGKFVYTCAHCIEEGHETFNFLGTDCCPGLRATPVGSGNPFPAFDPPALICDIGLDSRVCSRCGNGTCETWEQPCGCPEDCGIPCGEIKCPPGAYCLKKESDAGAATTRCVDLTSDCPDGVFSCACKSANCQTCRTGRWSVTCP
jgi:hypothetical protein